MASSDTRQAQAPSGSGGVQPARTAITRGERACEECRRMKVRCMREGSDRCHRCQHLNHECVMTPRARRGHGHSNARSKSARSVSPISRAGSVSRFDQHAHGPAGYEPRPHDNRHGMPAESVSDHKSSFRAPSKVVSDFNSLTNHSASAAQTSQVWPASSERRSSPSRSHSGLQGYAQSNSESSPYDNLGGSSTAPLTDDPLASEHIDAPFRQLRHLTDAHQDSRAVTPEPRPSPQDTLPDLTTTNQARDINTWSQQNVAPILMAVMSSDRSSPPDLVKLGLIQEDQGRRLLDYYYCNCNDYVLIHDVHHDTWDRLQSAPPILLASILAIAAAAKDGPAVISETQNSAMTIARGLLLMTIFGRRHTLADVQAILTIGVYHRNCWLLIGLATSLATNMGIDHAYPRLLATGLGRDRSGDQLELDRHLVTQARLWFALYSHDVQFNFANGRPPTIQLDNAMLRCREFLDHPLSIATDVRLVALIELLMLRTPLHVASLAGIDQPSLVVKLKAFKKDLGEWFAYYDRRMSDSLNLPTTSYYRESLRTQREYAIVFANSLLLRGISQPQDLRRLSDDAYVLAIGAVRSAQACLDIVIRGTSYPKMLRFAIPHTRMSASFAASFLLRTSKLFPDRLDPLSVASDVECLASMLAGYGAGQLAKALRTMLQRATAPTVGNPENTAPYTQASDMAQTSGMETSVSTTNGHVADGGGVTGEANSQLMLAPPPPDPASLYLHNDLASENLEFSFQDFWNSSIVDTFPLLDQNDAPFPGPSQQGVDFRNGLGSYNDFSNIFGNPSNFSNQG